MVQLINSAFERATSPAQTGTSDGVYSEYDVGYFGDHAGVYLKLTNPVRSESVQHLKFKDIHKEVMTEGEYKSPEQIRAMIESDVFGPEDRALLIAARDDVEELIQLSGRYRPMSTLDLEGR